MALDGEIAIRKVTLVDDISVPVTNNSLLPNPNPGCCDEPILNVLADDSGVAVQNDKSTVIWGLNETVTAATLTLYKFVDGAWASQEVISNNDYGTYGAFGYFVNNQGQKFISLEIDWSLVLAEFDTGKYKIGLSYTDGIIGNGTKDSYYYCLKEYSQTLAEGDIRLEYWNSGSSEDIFDDTLKKDYGSLVIYNTIRVKGFFGYPKSPYKSETIEYANGQQKWVEDRREPTYMCEIKFAPEFIHAIIRTDFMMADELAITDYNSRNNASYVTKYVIKDSEYSPNYYPLQSTNAPVSLQFKPQNNRSRKFRN